MNVKDAINGHRAYRSLEAANISKDLIEDLAGEENQVTRKIFESILADEEEYLDTFADLLEGM